MLISTNIEKLCGPMVHSKKKDWEPSKFFDV